VTRIEEPYQPPLEGTRKLKSAPSRTTFFTGHPAEAVIVVPLIVIVGTGMALNAIAHKVLEKPKATVEAAKPSKLALSEPVLNRMNETVVDGLKNTLGWMKPPLAESVHDGRLPSVELEITHIALFKTSPAGQQVVLCVKSVIYPTRQGYETCHYEPWDSAIMESSGTEEAVETRLYELSRKLGQLVARDLTETPKNEGKAGF
jgi:hypothetical protein